MPEWLEDLLYKGSKNIMQLGRRGSESESPGITVRKNEAPEGEAQATYLLPRSLQRKQFLKAGYIEGTPGDYGLVKKAVGNNNFPVYQTAPDAISRDQLVVIGNNPLGSHFTTSPNTWLQHAGHYPSAIYTDAEGNLYQKSWDLNDYGNSTGRAGATYRGRQWEANLIDKIGSPVVVTTGFQPIKYYSSLNSGKSRKATLLSAYPHSAEIRSFIKSKGLVPYYGDQYGDERDFDPALHINEPLMFTLPEIVVYGRGHKK